MGVRNCAEVGENLRKIMKVLMGNTNLTKLLYYTDADPLNNSHTTPTKEQIYEKLIKVIPKVTEDELGRSIIVIKVDSGMGLNENVEFKRLNLVVEIFVPLNQWLIKDTNLRPFAIMGEIQKLLKGLTINGLGKLDGGDFEVKFITEEVSCYQCFYSLISYD